MEAASVPTDGAAEGQEQGTEGEGQEPQSYDPAPILERLDEMQTGLRAELDERFAAMQPAEEPAADQTSEQLREVMEGEDVDPEQARALFDRMVEQKATELVSPVREEVDALRMEREVDSMFEQFPELKADEGKLEGAWNDAFELAMSMTRGNREQAEWLANQPKMITTAYLAGIARQRAQGEQPVGDEVELESAGAAAPGGAEDPDDELRRAIRESGGQRNSYLTG